MSELIITPGCVVLIKGFDDIPAHQFLVDEVFDDFITGLQGKLLLENLLESMGNQRRHLFWKCCLGVGKVYRISCLLFYF